MFLRGVVGTHEVAFYSSGSFLLLLAFGHVYRFRGGPEFRSGPWRQISTTAGSVWHEQVPLRAGADRLRPQARRILPPLRAKPATRQADPLKRPLTEKQKKANSKALKQELSSTYKKWLNEDVIYIITPEEKSAFKQLSNDEERDQFIEQFWLRRDPTPDTPENEFKEEHYRRIAYANEHFAAGNAGLEDRSRPNLHHLGSARPDRVASHRRHLRTPAWKKAAARPPRILSKTGAIAIWKESARKSTWSSSIPAFAAITT